MKFNNIAMLVFNAIAFATAITFAAAAPTLNTQITVAQAVSLPSASTVCIPGYRLYPECMRHSRPVAKVNVDAMNDSVGCHEIAPIHTPRVEARAAAWNKTIAAKFTETLPLNKSIVVNTTETPMGKTISVEDTETPEEVPLDETSIVDNTETPEEVPEAETTTVEDTETAKKLPVCVAGPNHESTHSRTDCYEIPHYIPAYREPKWEKIVDKTTSLAMKGIMTVAPFIPFMIPRSLRHDIDHLSSHETPRVAIGLNESPFLHHLGLKNHAAGEKHIANLVINLNGSSLPHPQLKSHTMDGKHTTMDEKHIVIHGKNVTMVEEHITIDEGHTTTDEITAIEARRIPCQPGNPHHFPGCENPPEEGGPIGLNGSPLLHHPEITNLTVEDRRLHCEAGNSHHLPACGSHNRPSPWLSRPDVHNATRGNSDLEWQAGKHSKAQTTGSVISEQVPAATIVARDFMVQTTLPVVPRPSPIATSSQSFLTVYTRGFVAQTTIPVVPESASINTPSQISVSVHSRRAFWDKWLIHF